MYAVLAALACKQARPPIPPPQERCSYDKAKYKEVQKKEGLDDTDKGIMNNKKGTGVEYWKKVTKLRPLFLDC